MATSRPNFIQKRSSSFFWPRAGRRFLNQTKPQTFQKPAPSGGGGVLNLKPMKTLFKGQNIEVFYQEGKSNAKCIFLRCTAVNPVDGKIYQKTAGWISRNLAFHQCNKAPKYIFEAASNELQKNKSLIFPAVVQFFKGR